MRNAMRPWSFLVFGVTFCLTDACLALDSGQDLTQVAHTAWLTQDGFFQGTPTALAQDPDGYLWIGTTSGINLFDGARFSPWDPEDKAETRSAQVNALLRARDGSMWIGTDSHTYRWRNGQLTSFLPGSRVNAIAETTGGTVYVSRSRVSDSRKPLCAILGARELCYGESEGIPFPYADPLIVDSTGSVWIASSTRVAQWREEKAPIIFGPPSPSLKSREGLAGFTALAERPGGGIWAGFHEGLGLGLQELVGGIWTLARTPGLDTRGLGISKLFVDREDALWIGTFNRGIYRIAAGKVDHFAHVDGLSGDDVNDIFEDREKNIWVATSRGIDRFRNLPIVNFSLSEGLSSDGADSVLATPDGTVWIGNNDGLDALKNGQTHSNFASAGVGKSRVTSLMQDHEGRLWIGSGTGLVIKDGANVSPVVRPDGLPIGVVVAMAEDREGNVWVLRSSDSTSSLLRLSGGKVREEFTNSQIPRAASLAADPEAGIWIGLIHGQLGRYQHGQFEVITVDTSAKPKVLYRILIGPNGAVFASSSHGLFEWRDGIAHRLSEKNGLPCDDIFAFIFDNGGALWLYSSCGVVRVAREDLANWWAQPEAKVSFSRWDALDGAEPKDTSFTPSATRSPDGRLWFANGNVIQMIDPRHLIQNPQAPPVLIERLLVDRKDYPAQSNLILPPRTRDIEFGFTATSLTVPQKVRFKYKLDGYDETWREETNRRQAFYTNLPPGNYQFHVIARNEDGVWNNRGASIEFFISRAWYQTIWFALACFLISSSVGVLIYRLRIRQVRTILLARFDDRLAERTRLAQELHDTLLQTIQASQLVASDALDRSSDLGYMLRSMRKLSDWLTKAMEEGRTALNSLRSPTTQTTELLREFNREIEHCVMQNRLEATISAPTTSRELQATTFTELARIGCEVIRNAFSHSEGSSLSISLEIDSGIRLVFRDDGKGIADEILNKGKPEHYGLQGIRERADRIGAQITIERVWPQGTQITVYVPERLAYSERNSRKHSRSNRSWRTWFDQNSG